MARFVAAFAIDPGQAAASRARIAAFVARSPGFRLAFAEGAATIAVEASAQTWQDRGTVVTGALFERAPLRPTAALSPGAFAAIGGSRGAHLVRHHWGGYVALLADPKGTTLDIIRGPLGELPCYIADEHGTVVAASDMAALRACGHARVIDPAALARHLLVGDLRRGETCLTGVRELAGGDRLALAATGAAIEPLWSPWSFTAPDGRTAEERDAALRDTARACVAARAAPFRHVVLKLSGGLDSSIVAACLAGTGRSFSCVTLATAKRALANGDGSEVQLLGDARVNRPATAKEEAVEFRGEFLHAFRNVEVVRSHLPVVMTQGTNIVRAATMNYDNLSQVVQFQGRASATFAAKTRSGG